MRLNLLAALASSVALLFGVAACGGPAYPISDWEAYRNEPYGYEIRYPKDSQILAGHETLTIYLAFAPATNLREKFLVITVRESAPQECANPLPTIILDTEFVQVGGIEFRKEIGEDRAAGSTYESINYSTLRGNRCFGLSFVLHSVNPMNYDVPPPTFDREMESEMFMPILSTFRFV